LSPFFRLYGERRNVLLDITDDADFLLLTAMSPILVQATSEYRSTHSLPSTESAYRRRGQDFAAFANGLFLARQIVQKVRVVYGVL
jgi:hypothetical protein